VELARMLLELESLAARIGIAIRAEAFDTRVIERSGGLCILRGKPVIVVDARAPLIDKIAVLADALAAFDLEPIYVPPLLRARIQRRRTG
jgi:hypothetical protein